ncbi:MULTISPECIES: hypothetical protein [Streptosporangium]|uniref:Transposase n=1 Tax=Streptosporangium brasiliense TaxID=47480 RepID=A0ABT9RCE5_9ACTN|nr:hypothetical protein [Streptosporangium brasiliense]MDP9866926.1 hypothetical protein [Streptosporangium brasiliense]
MVATFAGRISVPGAAPVRPVEIVFCLLPAGVSASGVTWPALRRAFRLRRWWVARRAAGDLDERWRDYACNG